MIKLQDIAQPEPGKSTPALMIDNNWIAGSGAVLTLRSPVDGSVRQISGASAADVDDAVAAARHALTKTSWSALKSHERAAHLNRIAQLVKDRTERLALAQMRDNGKTITECRSQVASAAATFFYYASVCETFEGQLTTQRAASVTMTVYEPMGVVAAITPWNSPLTLEAQKLAPILAAGNTVVLKPSEVSPSAALELASIIIDAGVPAGVVNVLAGDAGVGRALVEHVGTDMISFTGGTAAGKAIAEMAGQLLKPVVLELGGKSPNVVFADADLDKAAAGVTGGIFSGSGQSCVAGSRIFVQREIFEPFLDKLTAAGSSLRMGAPENEDVEIGPLASFAHRDSVAGKVEAAVAAGARVVIGGVKPIGRLAKGAYYPPTILTNVSNTDRIAREEIFGPVAVVLPFTNEADLIAQANDSDFGLAAGIWTGDYRRAWRVGRALRAGTVWINTYKELSISAPFGGLSHSGIGREKGIQGMRTYMQPKSLYWHIG